MTRTNPSGLLLEFDTESSAPLAAEPVPAAAGGQFTASGRCGAPGGGAAEDICWAHCP